MFRQCKLSDLNAVALLVQQLYAADPGELPAHPNIESTFAEFERQPEKGKIIVIEHTGTVVGYAILVFFWSNEFGGDIIEIDELLIDERYRNLGIGKAFFQWLDSEYPSAVGYALQTSEKNELAKKLYRSAGFVRSRNEYFIKLK